MTRKHEPIENDTFVEALRKDMLKKAIDCDAPDRVFNDIKEAKTLGDLIDINYYEWGLFNDPLMLVDILREILENIK